jgi:hypothetical protein
MVTINRFPDRDQTACSRAPSASSTSNTPISRPLMKTIVLREPALFPSFGTELRWLSLRSGTK